MGEKKKLTNLSAHFDLNCQQLFIGRKSAKSDRNHAEDSLITYITQILSEPNHRGFSNTRQKTSFYPLTHPLSGELFTPNQFLLSLSITVTSTSITGHVFLVFKHTRQSPPQSSTPLRQSMGTYMYNFELQIGVKINLLGIPFSGISFEE